MISFSEGILWLVMASLPSFGKIRGWGGAPLADQYPLLYIIVRRKNILLADILAQSPLNIQFWRVLIGNKWEAWLHMVEWLMTISLTQDEDKFVWKLTWCIGCVTVKSLYADYMNGHTVFLKKYICKLKVLLKIRIFMWFLFNKLILTKDNLVKRRWNGYKKCAFCDTEESIYHLFFVCPFLDRKSVV